eukprot:scaffold320393_cov28-Tisochrysis_lutea.AAC.2
MHDALEARRDSAAARVRTDGDIRVKGDRATAFVLILAEVLVEEVIKALVDALQSSAKWLSLTVLAPSIRPSARRMESSIVVSTTSLYRLRGGSVVLDGSLRDASIRSKGLRSMRGGLRFASAEECTMAARSYGAMK